MMSSSRRFMSLGRSDRRLVLETASLMAVVWIGIRLLRFQTLRRLLNQFVASPSAGNIHQPNLSAIDRVPWAISAVAARWPSATCLVQAIAADVLLRRNGLACELRLGVRVGGHALPLEAHAWVECNGAVAIGALEDLSTFELVPAPRSP